MTLPSKNASRRRLGPSWLPGWVCLAIWLSVPVSAHLPEGRQITAFQFPSQFEPVVDGNLDDWAIAGPPAVTGQDLIDLVGTAVPDAADFDVRLWVGWVDASNRLFLAAEVVDDIHQIDRPEGTASARIFLDDDMEVFVDPDHSGGQFADFSDLSPEEQLATNGTSASHFVMSGPHPDGDFFVNFSAAAWYALDDGPHTAAAIRFSGTPGGPGVMRYEISLTPFDQVNVTADFLSRQHDMREGEVLGLNVEFNDFDVLSDVFEAKWSLSGGQNAFRLSERFSDVQLAPLEDRFRPTSIQATTWARIKASFAPR